MIQMDNVGRVTIPKTLRIKLGLKKGKSNFDIFERNGEIVVKPISETFNINLTQMDVIRKVYDMIKDIDLLDETELSVLREACYISNVECPKCGTYMYYTKDKKYECPKCK